MSVNGGEADIGDSDGDDYKFDRLKFDTALQAICDSCRLCLVYCPKVRGSHPSTFPPK